MELFKKFLLPLLFLTLTQCQSKSTNGDSASSSPTYGNPDGTWKKSCFFDGQAYIQETITISGTGFSNLMENFSTDSTCTTKVSSLLVNTSFIIEGASTTLSNTYNATLELQAMQLTVHTAEFVSAFNTGSICSNSWILDQAKSVLNCTAISSPAAGTSLYYIYQVDNTKTPRELFIGDGIAYPVNTSDRATVLATQAHIEQSN